MTNLSKFIRCWGILDICYIVYDIATGAPKAQTLFYYQIKLAFRHANFSQIIMAVLGILLYLSIIWSGLLLYNLKKQGVLIVYLQTPFRLFFVTPSLFFIFWPFPFLARNGINIETSIAICLVVFIEILKLLSVVYWHKSLRTTV